MKQSQSPLRAALVGISGHARSHLLLAMDQVLRGKISLRAAVVINQHTEAFFCARLVELGCRLYPSVDALWAECRERLTCASFRPASPGMQR